VRLCSQRRSQGDKRISGRSRTLFNLTSLQVCFENKVLALLLARLDGHGGAGRRHRNGRRGVLASPLGALRDAEELAQRGRQRGAIKGLALHGIVRLQQAKGIRLQAHTKSINTKSIRLQAHRASSKATRLFLTR